MSSKIQFTAGYRILPDLQMIIDARFGTVTVDGLLAFKKQLEEDPLFDKDYYSIVDTREMDWGILITDVVTYIQELAKMPGGVSSRKKAAGIFSSVHQLAYTQIIHREFLKVNQQQQFFTELAPALQWLEKDISPEEVEAMVFEIKRKPDFVWKM
jgi:hypothetical protein